MRNKITLYVCILLVVLQPLFIFAVLDIKEEIVHIQEQQLKVIEQHSKFIGEYGNTNEGIIKSDMNIWSLMSTLQTELICLKYGRYSDECKVVQGF